MKNSFLKLSAILCASFVLFSCGGGQREENKNLLNTLNTANSKLEKGRDDVSSAEIDVKKNSCLDLQLCDIDYNGDHVIDELDLHHLQKLVLLVAGEVPVVGKVYDLNNSQNDEDPTFGGEGTLANSPGSYGLTSFDVQIFSHFLLWLNGEADYPTALTACDCFADVNYPEGHQCAVLTSKHYHAIGQGTNTDPHQIFNRDQLIDISYHAEALDKAYIQCADINLENMYAYFTIGSEDLPFTGSFDGKGFVIRNYRLTDEAPGFSATLDKLESSSYSVGLFGKTISAVLKNITMEGVYIDMPQSKFIGGLVGRAETTQILNSKTSGTNVTGGVNSGGLAGLLEYSLVTNSHSNVKWVAGTSAGGFVGWSNYSDISSCYATGVIGDYSNTLGGSGGFAGGINGGTTKSCFSTGTVSGTIFVGGFTGGAAYGAKIENCYSTGNVLGTESSTGGFIGWLSSGEIRNSYSSGNVKGKKEVGGFVGSSSENSNMILNSYSIGSVEGEEYVGGFAGLAYGQIINVYAAPLEISGVDFVGFVFPYGGSTPNVSNVHYYSGVDCSNCQVNVPQGTPHAQIAYFFKSTKAPMNTWDGPWLFDDNQFPTLP